MLLAAEATAFIVAACFHVVRSKAVETEIL